MTDTTCQVCDTTYNKRANKAIACQHCAQTACAQCWEQYFMSDNPIIFRPRCMMPDCRREFISDFLRANFTNHFLTHKLRERQAGILSDISANYMPQTQQIIGIRDIISAKNSKIQEYTAEARRIELKIHELQCEINTHNNNITYIFCGKKANTYMFTQKCPTDNCAGYLSTPEATTAAPIFDNIKYCTLCKKHTCVDCNASVEDLDKHTCDPDMRRTLTEIRRHAKPCPKCGVYISKTEGCNDMFCSLCNTTFRYDTGKIQAHNSNPLYAEYVRRMGGRERKAPPADIVVAVDTCVELNQHLITNIQDRLQAMVSAGTTTTNALVTKAEYITNAISHVLRLMQHCNTRQQESFQYHERLESLYNTPGAYDLRLALLNKSISDTQYSAELYDMCKANDKKRDVANTLEMYSQSLRDILIEYYQYIMQQPLTPAAFDAVVQWGFYARVITLTDYTNNCFTQLAANYKMSLNMWISIYTFHRLCKPDKETLLHRYGEHSSKVKPYIVTTLTFNPSLYEGRSKILNAQAKIREYKQTPDIIVQLEAINKYIFDDVPIA